VKLATLTVLAALEQEMAGAGRTAEKEALHEARRALSRPRHGFITTGQAAERLGVSIPTVKRFIYRGALAGGPIGSGGRWLVDEDRVEHLLRLRSALKAMDHEGNPTVEEIQELYRRSKGPTADHRDVAS
jgi:excisionase family DNA binding protein